MKIKKHIPGFVEGGTPIEKTFTTETELLNMEFVKNWEQDKGFYRFSLNDYADNIKLLMAEFDNGRKWWVVGLIIFEPGEKLNLPEWEPIR